MMNSAVTGTERMGVLDVVLIGFFSVETLGILPVSFFAMSRARRNRFRPFFARGLEALATVRTFKDEATAFGEKLVRIGYDFEADGRTHRGSDQV